MKKILFGIITATIFFTVACKDNQVAPSPLVSLILMNATINNPAVKLGKFRSTVAYASSVKFTLQAGKTPLYLFPTDDSLHPYMNKIISTSAGDIYSLYLTGKLPNIDTVFTKETIIPRFPDSFMAIRFINLSQGSVPVSINIQGSDNGSEITSLSYLAISDFKSYSAKNIGTEATRTFEVRNASSGDLLSTYKITGTSISTGIPRFHSITLVIRGNVDGSPALGITRINNF
jgi:hypothetical protein